VHDQTRRKVNAAGAAKTLLGIMDQKPSILKINATRAAKTFIRSRLHRSAESQLGLEPFNIFTDQSNVHKIQDSQDHWGGSDLSQFRDIRSSDLRRPTDAQCQSRQVDV